MNFVYENIAEGEYQKIKLILSDNIGNYEIEEVQHCNEALKFINENGSLNLRYYKTKKLMFQGDLNNIEEIIEKIKQYYSLKILIVLKT